MATAMPPDRIAPSTTACVVGASILAGVVGYFIGQGAWLFSYSSKSKSRSRGSQEKRDVQDVSDKDDWESDDDEADEDGGELATFEGNQEEVKLVLVVRTDLGMTKGLRPACLQARHIVSLINADCVDSQAKSLHNVHMLPSRATNTTCPKRRIRRY